MIESLSRPELKKAGSERIVLRKLGRSFKMDRNNTSGWKDKHQWMIELLSIYFGMKEIPGNMKGCIKS